MVVYKPGGNIYCDVCSSDVKGNGYAVMDTDFCESCYNVYHCISMYGESHDEAVRMLTDMIDRARSNL